MKFALSHYPAVRFSIKGRSVSEHVFVLNKEVELIAMETAAHRHMLSNLRNILDYVRLTREQIVDVRVEIAWRRRMLTANRNARLAKQKAIKYWQRRTDGVRSRNEQASAQAAC